MRRKKKYRKTKQHKNRGIDIGYRARKLPFWIGKVSLKKWQISEKFQNTKIKHNLKLDISNENKDVFYGDSWYEFLLDCRITLGTEGGASLLDMTGKIKEKVDKYIEKKPDASFEEVRDKFFKDIDGNINNVTISPRFFDACITKTCQILIEGKYSGIIRPNIHYIELKKDYSNLQEVLSKAKDVEYCEQIAERAYKDVVESKLYTYRKFAEKIISHVKKTIPQNNNYERSNFRTKLFLKHLKLYDSNKFYFSIYNFLYRLKTKL